MTPEERRIAAEATRVPGNQPLLFLAMTACDCGCGLKDRFDFTVAGFTISIDSPEAIDALIEEMQDGRRKLWGAPRGGGEELREMADSWESLVRHARSSKSGYITAATHLEVAAMADEIDRQRKTMGNVADELDQIALMVRGWLSRPTLAATLGRLAERLRISGEPGSPDPPRHTPVPPPPETQRSA